MASQVGPVVKKLLANTRDIRNKGSIPGSKISPGGGHDNPLQYSHLENPMDRGAWWATVNGVAKSQKKLQLKQDATREVNLTTLSEINLM